VNKGVKVTPDFIDVGRGVTQIFSALDSDGNSTSVVWTLSGAADRGTNIGAGGTLTVSPNETSEQLVVKAVSTANGGKFGTAVARVQGNGSVPIEKGIKVSPGAVTVRRGERQTFTALFGGAGNEASGLAWSVEGGNSTATGIDESTGVLTVAADESAAFIMVKASASGGIYGTAAVFVENGAVISPEEGPYPENAGIELKPPAITLDKGAVYIFTVKGGDDGLEWSLTGTNASTVSEGVVTIAEDESAEKITVKVCDNDGNYGTAIVAVRGNEKSAELVNNDILVSPQIVFVNMGGTYAFTAAGGGGKGQPSAVKWRVLGNGKEGTAINGNGVLTVAPGETAACISVRAEDEATGGYGTAIVFIKMPVVSALTITPEEASVVKGGARQFSAHVTGSPGVPLAVNWSITTSHGAGTNIDGSTGILNVAVNESAPNLTIMAVSAENRNVYSTAAVNVIGLDPSKWTIKDVPSLSTTGFLSGGIAYGGGVFVVGGSGGSLARSTDNGETWQKVVGQTNVQTIRTAAYGGGIFVIAGSGGLISYSADSGLTWNNAESQFSGKDIRRVRYAGGKFFAIGDGSRLSYSMDGKSWTAVAGMAVYIPSIIEDIAYHDGVFILVGGNGMTIAYSVDDGASWKKAANGSFNTGSGFIMSIAHGKDKFVVGSNMENGKIGYSVAGTGGWVESSSGSAIFGAGNHVMSIEYEGGVFVAVGGKESGEGRMAYSYDGETWTRITGITVSMGTNLAYGAGRFVAVGTGGKVIIMN
jgi:hypothetical protein